MGHTPESKLYGLAWTQRPDGQPGARAHIVKVSPSGNQTIGTIDYDPTAAAELASQLLDVLGGGRGAAVQSKI